MKKIIRFSISALLLLSVFSNPCKLIAAKSDKKLIDPIHLRIAARDGDIDKIKSLIANGADVNAKNFEGDTPIHVAVMQNRKDVVELLINKGANVNVECEEDCYMQDILSSTANTPLQIAALKGYSEIAELLIKNGAKVNAKAKSGHTALHYAVFKGHKAIVDLLLDNQADPHLKDKNGRTILEIAVEG